MKNICVILAIGLAVLFSAVNLFLPYALLVIAGFVALALSCGVIKKSRNRECRLGFC